MGADADTCFRINTNCLSAQPLHHIVKRGNALAVQLLVAAGADVNSPSREGLPIHLAARNDNVEVVQALLAAGADPTKLDQMGNNAVDFMCRGTCTVHTMPRFLAILQLFSASCHMRLQLDNYRIFTVDWDNSPIMELLIEKFGMDVHQRNNAHYLSAYFGMQFSVVAMLLRHGFDPNARSNNGRSLIGEIDKERGIRREMTKSLQALIVAGLELRAPAIRGAAETNLDVIIRCNWLPSMDLTLPPAEIRRRCAAALRTAKELQRPEKLL